MNQKCPVQVGPVLTCCHRDPNVKGEGGVAIWCAFVSVYVCVLLFMCQKALIGQWMSQTAVTINNMKAY